MGSFKLLNYRGAHGEPRPGILAGDTVVDLEETLPAQRWSKSTLAVLGAWEEALPALHRLADAQHGNGQPLARVQLLAPLPVVQGE